MMRIADYIVERLHAQGVGHIFLVTGRGNLYLSDAIARHKGIKPIPVHHEQAASFAAMGYAQYTGGLGACLVSTGCGSTNAITGLLCAWQDDIPVVFVSGQNWLRETSRHTGIPLRTFGQQEADIVKAVEGFTKYAVMLSDPKKIAYEIDKALHLATEGRKGPVWIDVPLDVQDMRVEPETLERFVPNPTPALSPTADDLQYVVEALKNADRPVLLLGSGVRSAKAADELQQLLERWPIPVTYAASAVDIYGAGNPLSIGTVGSIGGSRAGNFAVQNCDLLLVLGCRLSPVTTGPDYHQFARAAKIIVVDIDPVEHTKKTVRIDRLIVADVRLFLSALLQADARATSDTWREKCLHWKKAFPMCEDRYKQTQKVDLYYLAEGLTETLVADASVVTDSGLEELIIPSALSLKGQQRCIHPASQGSMGYALAAGVGAYFASGRQVVVVVGDGSIMMNLQELQTIRHFNIPTKIFVINNNVYAVIRRRQTDLFRSRTIGTDPSNGVSCPDFQKVAACFDLPYMRVDDSENLKAKLAAVLDQIGPVLCEVMGLENQEYLRSSYAFNSKRRMVQRPLEDQAPFLERSVLQTEMLIPPLD
jgi:acetolactate synthase-1/2/3 large subunit